MEFYIDVSTTTNFFFNHNIPQNVLTISFVMNPLLFLGSKVGHATVGSIVVHYLFYLIGKRRWHHGLLPI